MTERMFRALSALLCAGAVLAASAGSVTISLDTPKQNVERKHYGTKKTSASRNKNMTDKSTSVTTYTGRIMGMADRDKTLAVQLEAYFVSRGVGENAGPEKVEGPETVGVYTFGKGHPGMHKFTVTSPKYSSSVKTVQRQNRRSGYSEKSKSGRKLVCLILRAVSGGKVLRSMTEPYNAKWDEAAKKPEMATTSK